MRFTSFLLCLVLMVSAASCRKSDEDAPLPPLTGTWQELEQSGQFSGSNYHVAFGEHGNFRLRRRLFTDMLEITPVPCSNSRTQFAKGIYTLDGATISFSGHFCDGTFTNNIPDCKGSVLFGEDFRISSKAGWLILDPGRNEYERIFLQRE